MASSLQHQPSANRLAFRAFLLPPALGTATLVHALKDLQSAPATQPAVHNSHPLQTSCILAHHCRRISEYGIPNRQSAPPSCVWIAVNPRQHQQRILEFPGDLRLSKAAVPRG
jgi:hypothetical protein